MNRVLAKDNALEHAQLFLMISSRLAAPYFVKYASHAGLHILERFVAGFNMFVIDNS